MQVQVNFGGAGSTLEAQGICSNGLRGPGRARNFLHFIDLTQKLTPQEQNQFEGESRGEGNSPRSLTRLWRRSLATRPRLFSLTFSARTAQPEAESAGDSLVPDIQTTTTPPSISKLSTLWCQDDLAICLPAKSVSNVKSSTSLSATSTVSTKERKPCLVTSFNAIHLTDYPCCKAAPD